MNWLLRCCLCIPLEPACYSIGIFYIIINCAWLKGHVEEYVNYGDWDTEFRDTAQEILLTFRIVLATFEIALGLLIIFVTFKRWVLWLNLCACAAGVAAFLNFMAQVSMPVLGQPLTPYAFLLVFSLYQAAILCSYGEQVARGCVSPPPTPYTSPLSPLPPQSPKAIGPWHQEPIQVLGAPHPLPEEPATGKEGATA